MIIYSQPGCGGCELVKRILREKNIEFTLSDDFTPLIRKGIRALPAIELEVEGVFLSGKEAIEYAKRL